METKPPSSATEGFFQESPDVRGTFDEDEAFKRVFRLYLPPTIQNQIAGDLERFSNLVLSPQVLAWCSDAERNPPYLRTWDSWGRRIDELNTSEGWRELQKLGIAEGIVSLGYDSRFQEHSRVYQFLKYHIWTPSSAFVTCPSAMTDGAARLLFLQLQNPEMDATQKKVFRNAFESLTSCDPLVAKTSGQWMTERTGGSDVRETETQAIIASRSFEAAPMTDVDGAPLGPYSISGFKWFSSATDAAMTVLLAKEPSGAISAFFAPMRRRVTSSPNPAAPRTILNGISIQKLKSKLGTRALPTAELVLSDMRAWPIGKSGEGTKEISTVLNITRVHNAVTAVGVWGRGLAISRAFSRVRKARGRLLMDTPVHVRTLAEQHVQYRAMMHLSFFATALLGICEHPTAQATTSSRRSPATSLLDRNTAPHLLRLLTPLTKMLTAKAAIAGLAECMESLGGVGYMENEDVAMNVARLFRDANVLSIWEGTTNVLADDLLRIFKGSAGSAVLKSLDKFVTAVSKSWVERGKGEWSSALREEWFKLDRAIRNQKREELALLGRVFGGDLGWIICAVLLGEDALSDGDDISTEICSRWFTIKVRSSAYECRALAENVRIDREVVFGNEVRQDAKL